MSGPGSLLARVFTASEDENRREILRTVLRTAPHERVLDIGCYDGELTARLGRAAGAKRLVGFELLEEHAAKARGRGVEVEVGNVEHGLPFDDASFDLVHANQVIEHLRQTDHFLREARRVCAPGGLVVLSTNNLSSWHNIACLALGWQPMPNHVSDEVHVGNPLNLRSGEEHADAGQTHLRIFTGRALAELAAHHGLETVELKTSGYYPIPPRAARPLTRLDARHGAFLIGVFRPASGYAEREAA